jgi:hypothetical protein
MPNTVTEGAPPAYTLDQLNILVGQKEDLFGPLYGLGNDGKQTTMTFNTDQNPPGTHAVLALKGSGTGTPPAGKAKVCEGIVFVVNNLQDVVASR